MISYENSAGHIQTGKIGEDISAEFLINRGYKVITRNFRQKGGEIDIVATKSGVTHFVEVKTISCENSSFERDHRPEENVHEWKVKRLKIAIQIYINEFYGGRLDNWTFDIMALEINKKTMEVRVNFIKDIVL